MPPIIFTPSAAETAVYDPIEVTLEVTEPTNSNPFTDIRVEGRLQRDGGPHLFVDGFCDSDDGQVFRIRFLPTEPGQYTYTVTYRQTGEEASETYHGAFTATDEGQRGLLRVAPEYPYHFQWSGTGEHFFWNSTTAYYLAGCDDDTMVRAIDRLHSLGVNRVRVALNAVRVEDGREWYENVFPSEHFSFRLTPWPAAHPEATGDPGFDVSRFHLPHWQKYERLLEAARQRDIIVSVLFYVDGQKPGTDPFGKENASGEDERRFYRYAAARFSAFSNVSWDVTNEYHLFRDDAWAETMGVYLRSLDPYGHLLSIHGFDEFHFRTSPWANFASYQSWDEFGGYEFMRRNRQLQAETGRPIPQINEEFGYEDHYPGPWGFGKVAPARNADSRRRLAWEITLAGCYQTTGERADTGAGGWLNGCVDESMTLLRGHAHLRDFFEQFAWWRSESRPDLVSSEALCLAEEGCCYVLYLPTGASATITLTPGCYEASRFNPRTGETLSMEPVVGPVWTSPKMPDAEDWALLLTLSSL